MAEPTNQSWTIPSTNAAAAAVQLQVVELIQQHGYKREAVFAVRLAIDEALVNAVKHGNQNDADKSIQIDFEINDERLIIHIQDEGEGFAPQDLPDPTAVENLSRPNGRGVMLMQAYMTDVQFSDGGKRVTLTKRHDCDKPHAG